MKCSYCSEGKCERKYENRFKCRGTKEGVSCACKCRMTDDLDADTKLLSTLLGAASIAGGIALTAATGGMTAPVGGFLLGAGASLISKPIRKDIIEEHLEFKDSVSEALVFGAVGSVVTTVGCATLVHPVATQIPIAGTLAFASIKGAGIIKDDPALVNKFQKSNIFDLSERSKYKCTVDLRSNIWSMEY